LDFFFTANRGDGKFGKIIEACPDAEEQGTVRGMENWATFIVLSLWILGIVIVGHVSGEWIACKTFKRGPRKRYSDTPAISERRTRRGRLETKWDFPAEADYPEQRHSRVDDEKGELISS
jgi:hypothetical protein